MSKDGHWEKDKLYETQCWGNDQTYDESEYYPYFQVHFQKKFFLKLLFFKFYIYFS